MPFSLKPRWRFISKAVYEEFKRSKWYKLVSIIAALWFILGIFNLFGLTIPAPSLSWRTATFFLIFLVVALQLVVEAVYRFHRRTVSTMYDDRQKAVWVVMKLTEVAGMATQIDRQYRDNEDEVPREVFQYWLGSLRTALQDLSPSAVSDFTNGHPEELDTVPDNRHVWFLFLRERLSKWITHQTTLVKQAKANHDQLGS
jgi:hypothetical protein